MTMGTKKYHQKKHSTQKTQTGNAEQAEYLRSTSEYHIPVMLKECCDALVIEPDGIYADGTLGGGGHTAEILSRLSPQGRLFAFDADENAIREAQRRFADELAKQDHARLVLRHENFFMVCSIKKGEKLPGKEISESFLHGILLDLGVSSRQLDTGGIGLSYRVNSRLDMRFGSHPDLPTAESLIATSEQSDLERILREYGEEPFAKPIARRIIETRRASPLQSTFDLRVLVEDIVPPHLRQKSLSRVFQAFRIAVNNELEILTNTLHSIIPLLVSGGRIVVLSYHSLEDRIVKTIFHEYSRTTVPDPLNPKSTTKKVQPVIRELTKKPLTPNTEEINLNYRARSAKLRVAEKL